MPEPSNVQGSYHPLEKLSYFWPTGPKPGIFRACFEGWRALM
jgi:hypothetical protein